MTSTQYIDRYEFRPDLGGRVRLRSDLVIVCEICKKGTEDPLPMFILHDDLWSRVAPRRTRFGRKGVGILCFKCAEERLGRPITLLDLKDCGITREMLLGAYIVLRDTSGPVGILPQWFLNSLVPGELVIRQGDYY